MKTEKETEEGNVIKRKIEKGVETGIGPAKLMKEEERGKVMLPQNKNLQKNLDQSMINSTLVEF